MNILASKTLLQNTFQTTLEAPGIIWDWASSNPNPEDRIVGRVDLIQIANNPGNKEFTFSVSVGVWAETIPELQAIQYGWVDKALAKFDPMIPVCSNGLAITLGSIQQGLPNKSAYRAGYSDFQGVWAITLFELNLTGR